MDILSTSVRRGFLLGTLAILAITSTSSAQGTAADATGRIAGRIIDGRTGAGLTDAGVQVSGTTIGTASSVDGRYSISRVPAGNVSVTVRRIGYAPKTVTGVSVPGGSAVEQDITLEPTTVTLQTQVVSATVERGTVNQALDQQRNAVQMTNSVTAEQITKSTDSDAAQAVRRVSGVTIQDGKYVFVRGLGERYTTATLNGARIPSPEPEKRVVPLDLFPSSLLQSITTSKTFTPDQAGDFSGAQVNIRTREFPARRVTTSSASFGYNSAATGKSVIGAPLVGSEWLAMGGSDRRTPAPIVAAGNFGKLTQSETNAAINSFRNAWSPIGTTPAPNFSLGLSSGGQAPIFGRRVGYIASVSYNNTQEIKLDEERSVAVPDGKGGTHPFNAFRGVSANRSVLLGGLFNLSTLVGTRTRVELNNTFNRTADNEAKELTGTLDEFQFETRRSALGLVERSLRSNQLRIERAIGTRQQLELQVTSSGVTRLEPDRSEISYVREQNPVSGALFPFALFSYNSDGARRTFGDLTENNVTSSADYKLGFGDPSREKVLKFGGAFRYTDRNAINTSYSLLGFGLTRAQREAPAEQIFDGRYTAGSSNIFTVQQNSSGGSYNAEDRIGAGYAMLELPIGSRLRLIGGARVEGADLLVNSSTTTGEVVASKVANTDVLPALIANVSITESQSLRLSASQTVSRPEYRELSPITYRDVIEQRDIFGNPALRRALIKNYDARWEWYPNAGEIFSLGVFAKRFRDPVERVDVATSGASQLSFVNADGATNFGFELDLRKGLDFLGSAFDAFTFFTNATVMRSEIDITSDKLSALTNKKRAMVGQAPYVVNGGLTYASPNRRSATVLYNVVGKRITAAGVTPLPDTYEAPRHILDFSLQFPVFREMSAKFDGKNLFDAPYRLTQGTVVRERYRAGRVLNFGLRWQP